MFGPSRRLTWASITIEREPMRACGHGLKRELEPYRGVRIFLMNCGEVQCGLSESDFFGSLPIAHEWIDAALERANGRLARTQQN